MKRHLSTLALLTWLAACASNPAQRDAERLKLYQDHAAAPVPSFQYFGRLDGWTPLGDTAVVVWTHPNEAYLLELSGRCTDLDFASAISLTNQSGRVYERFDKVMVIGSTAPRIPCPIAHIRPLDVKAIKQAEREKRKVDQSSDGA